MLKITPRVYKPNINLSLIPDNIVDTVKMHPISNLAEDLEVLYTEDVSTVMVDLIDRTLPLSMDFMPTHIRRMYNRTSAREFAKARVDCVMASGKTRCTIDKPISGYPVASISLSGSSIAIDRGSKTYDYYPAADTWDSIIWPLSKWINDRKTSSDDGSLILDYSGDKFSMNPWINKIVSTGTGHNQNVVVPKAADMLTDWIGTEGLVFSRSYALRSNWLDYPNFSNDAFVEYIIASPNALGETQANVSNTSLPLYNMYLPIVKNVIKIDAYTYDIEWSVPVRYSYAAASRSIGLLGASYEADNYAFVDSVTKITVQLSALPYTADAVDVAYSLNSQGDLTTSVVDKNIVDIDAGEVFALNTSYAGKGDWTKVLAQQLLSKYKHGKYVFSCDVSAKWALENNVRINTSIQVQLPDGNLLTRKGNTCTFLVKNIAKTYKDNSFIFTLKLLEA